MVETKFTKRVLDYYEWARRAAAARKAVELSFEDFINFRVQEHYIRCLGLTG